MEDINYRPCCVNCGAPSVAFFRGGYVCLEHYTAMFRADAERYCAEHGLVTVEDKIRHIREVQSQPKNHRAWMLNPKSPRAAQMAADVNRHVMTLEPYEPREPGSDDE
jgi:hypothetical protein